MPTIPITDSADPMLPPQQGGQPPPSPTMFAMAAATMRQHAEQQRSIPSAGDGKKLGTIIKGSNGRSRRL